MKKLSQMVLEAKEGLKLQNGVIDYISAAELKKYLEIADKFISDEAKEITQWLIDNNSTYIKDYGSLSKFYDMGAPKDKTLKKIYSDIGKLKRSNALREVPVFQTKNQFEGIINKKLSPDQVILDLETEAGRNAVATKYMPLVHKIVNGYMGKGNVSRDDLLSAALESLNYAMTHYNKPTDKANDLDNCRNMTFFSYASSIISNGCLVAIQDESHIVHIPKSQQRKEREEKGSNTRSFTVSGDESISRDSEGNDKSRFDSMGDHSESSTSSIDSRELDENLKRMYALVKKKFPAEDYEIWCSKFGLDGHEMVSNKELEAKYNKRISYTLYKINNFLRDDKVGGPLIREIRELIADLN